MFSKFAYHTDDWCSVISYIGHIFLEKQSVADVVTEFLTLYEAWHIT